MPKLTRKDWRILKDHGVVFRSVKPKLFEDWLYKLGIPEGNPGGNPGNPDEVDEIDALMIYAGSGRGEPPIQP